MFFMFWNAVICKIFSDIFVRVSRYTGGEVFETVDSDVHAESRDSQEMALRTADKLLKVLKEVNNGARKKLIPSIFPLLPKFFFFKAFLDSKTYTYIYLHKIAMSANK